MVKRILSWLIRITLAVLVLGYMGLYLFQDQLIFQSVSLDHDHVFTFDQPFQEHFISIPTSSGDTVVLNALWFKPLAPAKGLILYFHGNRGNLQRWGNYAPDLAKNGFEVLMIDYRGYGKSTGSPSEKALYDDASAVMNWVQAHGIHGKLVIYGRSLGSAVASHLAMEIQPDLLVLETPFDELRGVVNPKWQWLAKLLPLRSVFPNHLHLKSVKSRTLIFHGTDDRVVPLRSALLLRPLLHSASDFIIVPGGGHRNLKSYAEYQSKLAELLREL